jgi:IS5 family transposase
MPARSAKDVWASRSSLASKPRSSTTPTGSSSTTPLGNPPDAPQLAPAIERITTRTGHTPRAVTADRGYGQASVEHDLHQLGVCSVAIPRASKPSAARREFEHRRAFRDKVKRRTGSEGRINHIKRSYGWSRTELTGIHGARTWCGHGVFAHNLVKIGALAA